jgi:hypothetical protein
VNVFGELRFSLTTHIINRWRQRIDEHATYEGISIAIKEIAEKGSKYSVDEKHYRICYNGICVVFMKLSPLHALAKTVYEREESTLSAV